MADRFQFARGTAAEWTAANPVLREGEIGLETDTLAYKIGNGTSNWNSLNYRELSPEVTALLLGNISDPSAAPSGKLRLYSKSIGGRSMPKFVGESGLDSALQPALFGNGIQIIAPSTTTVLSTFGVAAPTFVGTASHPAITTAGLRAQTRRAIVTSAATANSASEIRVAVPQCWRGDAAGLGGFFFTCRFAFSSVVATQRSFIGLYGSTAAIATTQNPSGITNIIGVGNDLTDTNLQMMVNDGTGTATKVDLGANFPFTDANAVYELVLFAAPNAATVKWRMINFTNGAVAEGTFSSDLPASTTLLSWHAYLNNGGTAAAVVLEFIRMYLETDY
ncbi:MAG TPA: hypothetical protein PKY59_10280 [Pyrinomonadaceae bacterium]|nr:hypothetical protein [Pyrinomonadaceae bacterium]